MKKWRDNLSNLTELFCKLAENCGKFVGGRSTQDSGLSSRYRPTVSSGSIAGSRGGNSIESRKAVLDDK